MVSFFCASIGSFYSWPELQAQILLKFIKNFFYLEILFLSDSSWLLLILFDCWEEISFQIHYVFAKSVYYYCPLYYLLPNKQKTFFPHQIKLQLPFIPKFVTSHIVFMVLHVY